MFITNKIKAKDIKIGDLILSRNISTQNDQYRTVLNKLYPIVKKEDQIEIICDNNSIICTSKTHPMAVFNNEQEKYIETQKLKIGDILITDKGYSTIKSIKQGNYDENFLDFTIDENNNYYAGNDNNLILAHNSATINLLFWHYEIEDLLVLKNNKGTEDNRVRQMDYCIHFNKVMYERLLSGGNITLFSPHDVPELYDAFYIDVDKFRTLYEEAEKNPDIRKKSIPAIDLFTSFIEERKNTGRVYLMNVDHANDHGSFVKENAPIKMTNLCVEITLTNKPLNDINDENGEIALCTLAAINWGKINKPEDFAKPCELLVRALDELLDYQSYPVKAAYNSTMKRRPLGIGIINLAYWLANNGFTYDNISDEGLEKLHEYAEAWSYYLIKASSDLAKEKGHCPLVYDTRYHRGILPIDTYKKDVDDLAKPVYKQDWNSLREQLRSSGIRNSTLMACMPAECQHWENKICLSNGERLNFHELLEKENVDWEFIEKSGIPQRYSFLKPIEVDTRSGNQLACEYYYNGVQDIIEIEFESGVYKFTPNHKLLVNRNNIEEWIEVKELKIGDEIVTYDALMPVHRH